MPDVVFMGIDCGTSSLKAAIIDTRGRRIGLATRKVPCVYHSDGRITQDALALRRAMLGAMRDALTQSRRTPASVAAIAIANQRATLLALDRHDQPLQPAISWQDMTGAQTIARLRQSISDEAYYRITGLPLHAVFTLAKIMQLKTHDPQLYRRAARFVLLQEFLLRALGCTDFMLDFSNASLTGMMDVRRCQWSDDILRIARIPVTCLSTLIPSGQRAGVLSPAAARQTGLLAGTPLIAGGGDQQCAGAGAGVVRPGLCSITMGTAGVSFCHVNRVIIDPRRRITCCVHVVPGCWNLEGLQNAAGDSLSWINRRLGGNAPLTRARLAQISAIPPGARGALFLPYLAGASAPHWMAEATGAFLGLRQHHDAACLTRAVMEGVVFENRQILDVFASLHVPVDEIRLTGGCASLAVWNRIQADVYGRPVRPLPDHDATVRGVAMVAACGIGTFRSMSDAADHMVRVGATFAPDAGRARQYTAVYARYRDIVECFKKHDLFKRLIT